MPSLLRRLAIITAILTLDTSDLTTLWNCSCATALSFPAKKFVFSYCFFPCIMLWVTIYMRAYCSPLNRWHRYGHFFIFMVFNISFFFPILLSTSVFDTVSTQRIFTFQCPGGGRYLFTWLICIFSWISPSCLTQSQSVYFHTNYI